MANEFRVYGQYILPTYPTWVHNTHFLAFYVRTIERTDLLGTLTLYIVKSTEQDIINHKFYIDNKTIKTRDNSQITYTAHTVTLNDEESIASMEWTLGTETTADTISFPKESSNPLWVSEGSIIYDVNDEIAYQGGIDSISAPLNFNVTNNITWDYQNLVAAIHITGTGAIPDYYEIDNMVNVFNYPWKALQNIARKVVITGSITKIGQSSFEGFSQLLSMEATNVNSLTTIGKRAFARCTQLYGLYLPNSIQNIEKEAFYASSIYSVSIPKQLKNLDPTAFTECYLLNNFSAAEDVINFSVFDGFLYSKDKTILYRYPPARRESSLIIPNWVTTIGDYAFAEATYLRNVYFNKSINKIGLSSFYHCHLLESIKFLRNDISNLNDNGEILLNNLIAGQFENCTIYVPPGTKSQYENLITDDVTFIEWEFTNFNFDEWITGFIYGLTGQPLPFPITDIEIQKYRDVLYIKNARGIKLTDLSSTIEIL